MYSFIPCNFHRSDNVSNVGNIEIHLLIINGLKKYAQKVVTSYELLLNYYIL